MLRMSQSFSSYLPLVILGLQGKTIHSHRSFTDAVHLTEFEMENMAELAHMGLVLTSINSTAKWFIVVHLSMPLRSGFCFCVLQGMMGERQ